MNAKLLDIATPGSRDAVEVVASLPISFGWSSAPGQVVVIEGVEDWPTRVIAAIEARALGVIVTDPVGSDAANSGSLSAAAALAGMPILLSESWACNPTILGIRTLWSDSIASAQVTELTLTEPSDGLSNAELVLRQLRVLRRLGIGGVTLRTGTESSSSYSWSGVTAAGAEVLLFGVRSSGSEDELMVHTISPIDSVQLRLTSGRSARPASARRVTETGGELFATIYETAHRATFRRLHAMVTAGESVNEIGDFVDDLVSAQPPSPLT